MPNVLPLAFTSVDEINDAINNSAPALPDESQGQRNWQIWSIANNSRVDSGQPAYCKIYTNVADHTALTNTADGDIAIEDTWEVWQLVSGSWVDIGNIKGATGDDAEIIGATASVDSNVGTPSVTVTTTGTPDAQSFDFQFRNMKGDTGDAAGFGTPTATATTLPVGTPASASVAASGTDTSKVFAFSFGLPKGDKGDQGDPGTGNNWYVGNAIDGTSTTPTVYATGILEALVGDMYLNSNVLVDTYLGNVYRCVTAGDQTTAEWIYVCSIRGASGAGTGDMTKAQYDPTNSGSVVDSQKLGGHAPSYFQVETNALPAFSSPADSDTFPAYVAASSADGKITWSNLKAAIKVYTDTLYATNTAIGNAIDAAWYVSNYNVALSMTHISEEVYVIGHSVSGISVTSSDSTIASVSPHGDSFTVYAQGSGTCTLTVTDSVSMTTKTVSVTCTAVPSAVLNDNTPAQIQAAARAGIASQLWSVGDRIGIAPSGQVGRSAFDGTVTYYAYILGFDHNVSVEGNNTIHFQMAFSALSDGSNIAWTDARYGTNTQSGTTGYVMNTTATNAGGWASSYMRQTTCVQMLAAMPSAWQDVIAGCIKWTDNTGGGTDDISYMTMTVDKVFLLSQYEVSAAGANVNSGEPIYLKQYDYYANGNSKVKSSYNNGVGSECEWWWRSPDIRYADRFRCCSTSGGSNPRYGNYSYGFAPAFTVA